MGKSETIVLRVTPAEKQRAKDLADQCGLSMAGLWRAVIAETEAVPVVDWKTILRATQGRQNVEAVQG